VRREAAGNGRGFVIIEVLAVITIVAVLLGLSFSVYKGARQHARVVRAQNNLLQVGTAFELYYAKHHCFPEQGADLTTELAPFVRDSRVFQNPLMEETRLGQTLNALYYQPHYTQVDKPNYYITGFVSDDGGTAVTLKTGGIVEQRDGLRLPVDDLKQSSTQLALNWTEYATEPPPAAPAVGGFDIAPDGGTVVKKTSNVNVKSLGAQFGYANGTLVQMKAYIKIGNAAWQALFGGKVLNGTGGETFSVPNVPAGTKVLIKAEVYDSYSRNLLTRYGWPLSYISNDGTGQVVTLRNGDLPINNNPAYPCQVGVGDLLKPLVDPSTGRIKIGEDQCIYCFDFNPLRTGKGIDYNDVCILGTATVVEQ